MYRLFLAILVAGLAPQFGFAGQGGNKNTLADAAELYEKALQEVIKQAEPSIASVLVSRSDVYKKIFHDEPTADNLGKLGGFDASKADLPARPPRPEGRRRFGRGNMQNPQNELDVYDLSKPGTVPESYGSGVVIDGEKLLILTAYHVVRDATKIYVRLPGNGDEPKGSYADIHAADPRSDLAVLRMVDASVGPLKALKFGDAGTLRKGSLIVSLANLYGPSNSTASASAANGIVSDLFHHDSKQLAGLASPKEYDEFTGQRPLYMARTLIQTNATLNSGCSGGALLNLKGELVGLTTARAAMSGSDKAGGFAMPLDKVLHRIIARLRAGEEVQYGFLGVKTTWDTITSRVRITSVEPGSPAHEAGLIGNRDTIVSINGERVTSMEDVNLKISTLLAGGTAELELGEYGTRGTRTVSVTLAKTYTPGKIIASSRPAPVRGMRVDYATVLAVQRPDNQFRFPGRVQPLYNGVYIRDLQPGSKAAALLHLNDIITHVRTGEGLTPVNTPAEFYRLAAKIPPGQPLELSLQNSEPVAIP